MNQIMQNVTAIGVAFGMKVLGAIVVWVVGRYLIGLAVRLVSASLERQQVDPTVLRYLGTVISVTLNIILVVASWATLVSKLQASRRFWRQRVSPSAWRGAGCSPILPPARL